MDARLRARRQAQPWFAAVVLALACWGAPAADAALGGSAAGALADGQAVAPQHSLRASPNPQVTDTTVVTPAGVTVHEFSGADGVVFAIAWSGPQMPDLQQLLGSYFPAYDSWLQAHPPQSYRSPLRVRDPRVVAHAWGHMRAYAGSAYAPALVPAGVDLASLGVQP